MKEKFFLACQSLWKLFTYPLRILLLGILQGRGWEYIRYLADLFARQFYHLALCLNRTLAEVQGKENHAFGKFTPKELKTAQKIALGLHQLLPQDPFYSYSLLFVVDQPKASHFQAALQSALDQTAPNFEIVVGFNGVPAKEIAGVSGISVSKRPDIEVWNLLAEKANGNILVLLEQDGWMRPDLLLRYEQTFRMCSDPKRTILYSDEYTITSTGDLTRGDQLLQPEELHFPYFFSTLPPGCLAIPKNLWKEIGGFRSEVEGAQVYDFFLRSDLAGVKVEKIPVPLYGRRSYQCRSAAAIPALTSYIQQKKLDWRIEKGYADHTLRAVPVLSQTPDIHAIVLFKDQKELTLAAVKSLQSQLGVKLHITAVDNRSEDPVIAETLCGMGVEVIKIDEPFNFSRLNNLAVKKSRGDGALLFFMNNDVELEKDALLEMSRWIDQPKIGMVGCRLNYPNGLLQCGGVDINKKAPAFHMHWELTDNKRSFAHLKLQKVLRVAEGVSGAAALIKRETFLKVEGFDEIWYPIEYSDTSLAAKIKQVGLWCFYTPFAVGIHRESISRPQNGLTDYTTSSWLHKKRFLGRQSWRQ